MPKESLAAMMDTSARGRRKTRLGVVTSDKMDKTVTVKIHRVLKHLVYGRVVRRTVKVMAHDEEGRAKVGDKVRLMETRPLSKHKRWRLIEVIEKAK